MTVDAFNMAETYRTPVILLFDEVSRPHAGKTGHPRDRANWRSSTGCAPRCPRMSITIPICRGRTAGCRCPISAASIAIMSPVCSTTCGAFPPTTRRSSTACSAIWSTRSTTMSRPSPATRNTAWRGPSISWSPTALRPDRPSIWPRTGGAKGEKIGVLELQSLWPFPAELVREKCRGRQGGAGGGNEYGPGAGPGQGGGGRTGPGIPCQPDRRQADHTFGYQTDSCGSSRGGEYDMAVKDYLRERFFPHMWCPGCGHGTILNALLRAVEELELEQKRDRHDLGHRLLGPDLRLCRFPFPAHPARPGSGLCHRGQAEPGRT